jgi:hypothetical protein
MMSRIPSRMLSGLSVLSMATTRVATVCRPEQTGPAAALLQRRGSYVVAIIKMAQDQIHVII